MKFVIGGQYGIFYISTDGINWEYHNIWIQQSLNSITTSEELKLITGVTNGVVVTSTDGINWKITNTECYLFRQITYVYCRWILWCYCNK